MPAAAFRRGGFSVRVPPRGCTTSRTSDVTGLTSRAGGAMRKVTGVIVGLAIVTGGMLLSAADAPPPWAYGFAGPAPATPPPAAPPGGRAGAPPAAAPAPDDGALKHLPGSSGAVNITENRGVFGPG